MEYRQVGNIELRVSEIGFGCGGNAGLMVWRANFGFAGTPPPAGGG